MSELKTTPMIPCAGFNRESLARSGWLYPLLSCFLLVLLLSARLIGSYDLGTHLAGGRWIVQHHSFPLKDTFTYTQNDRDYQDFHGFYQIALYLVQKKFGYSALTILHMMVIVLTFILLLWRLKLSRSSPGLTCLLLLAAVLLMERRFVVRPEVFSWFYLSLTLLVLDLRLRNMNYLFLLPVFQLLWINTEALFMLGWLAMGAYALSGRLHQKKWDTWLVRYSLLSLGADLLNPYFFKGAAFPLVLLTRFQSGNLFKRSIAEFLSPWQTLLVENNQHDLNLPIILFFILSGLCLLLGLWTFQRRKIHEIILLSVFGWLGFSMVRNIPLFTLVSIPILGACLSDLIFKWNGGRPRGKTLPILLTLCVMAFGARVITNAYYVGDRRQDRFGFGLDTNRLPVKAAEFLSRRHLDGRLLNNLGFGGWLDWKGPQPTFIDGRLEVMDPVFFGDYLHSFQGFGLIQLFNRYQPQLIVAEYNSASSWCEQLGNFQDWRLIYLDECAAIYAHGGYAAEFPALDFSPLLSARQIPPATDESAAAALEQIETAPLKTWWEGYCLPQRYAMGLSGMGLFCLRTGEYPAARDFFMECLRQSGGGYEEIYFNLGVTYLRLKNLTLGKAFLQRALRLNPQNPSTLQMLAQLQR